MSSKNGNGKLEGLSKKQLLEVVEGLDATLTTVQESLADQQLALEDEGWRRLTGDSYKDIFGPEDIIRFIDMTRAAYLLNPLIRHAVDVQANYVFGQAVSMRATPTDEVNQVLQAWWDDRQNKKVLTSPQALWRREVQLRTEANLFLVHFTNFITGEVIVRAFPPEEFIRGGVIHNPDDKDEPWFYHRVWTQREFDPSTGTYSTEAKPQEGYYPDIDYDPGIKVETINGKPVFWESPVRHVKTGNIEGQTFGIPEILPALAWARAVKLDLEDYATIRRALSRFAWKMQVRGGKASVAQAKSKLESALSTTTGRDSNPAPSAGSVAIGTEDKDLQPIRLAGTTLNPEEGRRLWLMVSAGTGIPETILSGNADVGNLATARTLDRPTELQMANRQGLWEDILREEGMYVLRQSAQALLGGVTGDVVNGVLELRSRVVDAPSGRGRPRVVRQPVQVDVNFPAILERNKKENVDAIVDAITLLGREPKKIFTLKDIRRRVLAALGEPDIDGALAQMERDVEEGDDFIGSTRPDTQQPGGEARQNNSTRERVTNNEFVDQA